MRRIAEKDLAQSQWPTHGPAVVEELTRKALPHWIERAQKAEAILAKMAALADESGKPCEKCLFIGCMLNGCNESVPDECEYARIAEEARQCLEPSA